MNVSADPAEKDSRMERKRKSKQMIRRCKCCKAGVFARLFLELNKTTLWQCMNPKLAWISSDVTASSPGFDWSGSTKKLCQRRPGGGSNPATMDPYRKTYSAFL